MSASGIEQRTSAQANVRSRCRVVTSVAISQKKITALRYWSDSRATLPLGQYENGMVIAAQIRRANAITTSRRDRTMGCRRAVVSNIWARIETPAASRAIRRVLSTGSSVWGVSSRMAVKATRPPNATGLPGTSARIAGRSGRHQFVPESVSVNDGLHDVALPGGHPNRSIEKLHVFETGVAEPAVDLGVEIFPLVCHRVPIQRLQPP